MELMDTPSRETQQTTRNTSPIQITLPSESSSESAPEQARNSYADATRNQPRPTEHKKRKEYFDSILKNDKITICVDDDEYMDDIACYKNLCFIGRLVYFIDWFKPLRVHV